MVLLGGLGDAGTTWVLVLLTWTSRGGGTHISVPSLFPLSHPSLPLFRLSATTPASPAAGHHRLHNPIIHRHLPTVIVHTAAPPLGARPLRPFWRRPRRVYWVRAATPVPGVLGGRRGLGEAAGPMTTLTSGRAIVAPPVQSVAADGRQGQQGPMATPSAGPVGD